MRQNHTKNLKSFLNMEFVCLFIFGIFTVFAAVDSRFSAPILVNNELNPRIVGGDPARSMTDFPYLVSLRVNITDWMKINPHFCGGSIISNRFILSAAHCADIQSSDRIVAHMGSLNVDKGGVDLDIDKIIAHSGFDSDERINDISLFRTAKEIIFSDTIQPIALPKYNLPENKNTPVIVSGWGTNIYEFDEEPLNLLFTEQFTLSLNECAKRFESGHRSQYIHAKIMCAFKNESVGACHGDSGGPLVDVSNPNHKNLVGIVVWGVPCAKGYPDVYTRVYSYIDWIDENMILNDDEFE